jgi:arabinosyltransferase
MAAWCPAESTKPVFVGIYGAVLGGFAVSALFFLLSSFSSLTAPPLPFPAAATIASHAAAANLSGPIPVQPETMYNRPIWKPPPRGARMPPPRALRLTREMVRARARDGVIVVTFGNYAFLDFIITWSRHLTDLGVDNLLVGAMDTKLLGELYLRGVPVFDMGSRMDTEDVGWGSPTFHKMGREKVLLINALLPFGYELLMCDTDMVWLKNPLPYLAHYPDADLLTSSDQVIPTVTDDSLENWREGNNFLQRTPKYCCCQVACVFVVSLSCQQQQLTAVLALNRNGVIWVLI